MLNYETEYYYSLCHSFKNLKVELHIVDNEHKKEVVFNKEPSIHKEKHWHQPQQ